MRDTLALLPFVLVLVACGHEPGPAAPPSPATATGVEVQPTGATSEVSPPAPASPVASSGPHAPPEAGASPAAGETGCGLPVANRYVGRKATPALRAEVAAAIGQRPIRWIAPGDAVTMDFSESRLNMMLDAAGTIVSARCG